MTSRFTIAVHALGMLACEGARRSGKGLTSEEIARSANTNPVVVRRVFGDLRRAGLVETRRGAGGGVVLARPASKITLRSVWEAIEEQERLFAGHPAGPNPRCPVGLAMAGYLEDLYGHAQELIKRSLGDVTLSKLQRDVDDRVAQARTGVH
jgi:Rrf2 family protein